MSRLDKNNYILNISQLVPQNYFHHLLLTRYSQESIITTHHTDQLYNSRLEDLSFTIPKQHRTSIMRLATLSETNLLLKSIYHKRMLNDYLKEQHFTLKVRLSLFN